MKTEERFYNAMLAQIAQSGPKSTILDIEGHSK